MPRLGQKNRLEIACDKDARGRVSPQICGSVAGHCDRSASLPERAVHEIIPQLFDGERSAARGASDADGIRLLFRRRPTVTPSPANLPL